MNVIRTLSTVLVVAVAMATTGCQSSRVFYHPDLRSDLATQQDSLVVLAADFSPIRDNHQPDPNPGPQKKLQPKPPAATQSESNTQANPDKPQQGTPNDKKGEGIKGEPIAPNKGKSGKPSRRQYTAPSVQIQQITLLALGIASLGTTGQESVAQQASQSATTGGIVGRPELTAPPQARFSRAVVGKPGLQQGRASGLGFANPNRNIFTVRRNPLSGDNGGCAALTSAGFFNGNRTACENHFRR